MAVTIDDVFVEQYRGNIRHLYQQRESRLGAHVHREALIGETHNFERIGSVDAQQKTTRHGDTPILDAPFSRRRVSPTDWEYGDLVDREDKLRLLITPESNIAKAAAMSMYRKEDELIIGGAFGNARDHTDTDIPLPVAQQLTANDGAGGRFTFQDIRNIKNVFDKNEVPEEDRIAVISSEQLNTDMLEMAEVTNADFNPVYAALQEGKVPYWMGFKWIRSERLPLVATNRLCLFYQRDAIGLAVNEDMYGFIEKRYDKKGSHQVFTSMTMGATRIEDEGVVQLTCSEA